MADLADNEMTLFENESGDVMELPLYWYREPDGFYWRYADLDKQNFETLESFGEDIKVEWGVFMLPIRPNYRTRRAEVYVGGTW